MKTDYLIALATELEFFTSPAAEECRTCCDAAVAALQNLATALARLDSKPPDPRL